MKMETFGALLAFLVLPSLLLQVYFQRLPTAPQCPSCRAVTRQVREWLLLWWVPSLTATSRGECTRCGWHGRMRWKWATRSAGRG